MLSYEITVKDNFERFSMYSISIDYPNDSRVEFNSKGRREVGDVAFHLPEKVRIFLSWGELEKVSKRFNSVQEHAEFSLNSMKKGKNVRNFEQVFTDSVAVNTHKGTLNKVKFEEMIPGLPFAGKKVLQREAYSLHVHCDESKRYFVLYTMAPSDAQGKYDKTMTAMVDSFKCH
jgi:hypothetical protein